MTTLLLAAASTLSGLTFLAHVLVGGPKNAAPILSAPGLPAGPRTTLRFSWDAASLLLVSIALGYAYAAVQGGAVTLVWFLTLLSGFHGMLAVWSAARAGIAPWAFPPAILFLAITVCGGLALGL